MTPRLFTIAPHAPFLRLMAERVLDGTLLGDWPREGPFWLSDVTIILPTRRAADRLALEFADLTGGALLPDIRTFGGEREDEEPFLPPHDFAPLPKAIPPVTRRLLLAELVGRWLKNNPHSPLAEGDGPNPVQTLALSDSLATLIDDFTTEDVDPLGLKELHDKDLSSYWQDTLKFLEIALKHWPDMLAGEQSADHSELRNLRLNRQADTATLIYGDRPVIAAGSTGSIPATAAFMRAISQLKRGALVLPGLDTSLSDKSLEILRNPAADPHGHAQYNLVRLLDRIGASPDQVEELAAASSPRTFIVRSALALADETAGWHAARSQISAADMGDALGQVSLALAHGEQEQAAAVALAALDAVRQDKQVGIIAPDRNLARRIVTELSRFGIEADDSAGTPLHQSPAGRLVRQVLAVAVSDFAPVDLMALLRSGAVTLKRERGEIARLSEKIEFGLLRGLRPAPGIDGLRAMLDRNPSDKELRPALRLTETDQADLSAFFDDLETALAPLTSLFAGSFRAPDLATALCDCVSALRLSAKETPPSELPGQIELTNWATQLNASPFPGPVLDTQSAEPALPQLMAGFSVRSKRPGDPRVEIWGRLEARLQPADLMILTALNEGAWPEIADPGPWLSRQMRLGVGLEPPERQHGLAAHDFEMALGAPEVLLTASERISGSPATLSRFVQRLTGFAGDEATKAMTARGQKWIGLARTLDTNPEPPQPAARPEPRPAKADRPREISVTAVEQLFRSPYDLYAKGTLDLRALEPLGTEAGARERGNFIHDVFARFVAEGGDPFAADAHAMLTDMAVQTFAALETLPERRDIWLRRFEKSAEGFLAFERDRHARVAARYPEQKLSWTFPLQGEEITLYGRADRIDVMTDGTVEIIDFKTGSVPSKTEMQNYLAPQMLVEALIVAKQGFHPEGQTPVAPLPTSALTYIQVGASPRAFEQVPFVLPDGLDMADALDALKRRLDAQITLFLLSDTSAMMAGLFPKPNQRFAGDYDHLSRLKEWTGEPGEAAE